MITGIALVAAKSAITRLRQHLTGEPDLDRIQPAANPTTKGMNNQMQACYTHSNCRAI